jgi:prevent-host-death family protein
MTMYWQVAEAKAKLSEMLEAASHQPQIVRKRDEEIAVVIHPSQYQSLLQAQKRTALTIADALNELRAIQDSARKGGADVDV